METQFTVAAAVLAVVHDALEACGRTPGVSMIAAGGLVVDDCCEGLLIVAPERTYRTVAPFPTEAGADAVCLQNPIGVDILVYLATCVPVLDDRGKAPPIADQEAGFAKLLTDAAIVWNAVNDVGLLGDDGYGDALWERANIVQTYTGPEGGCIASETRFTLGIPQHLWCPPCVPPEEP